MTKSTPSHLPSIQLARTCTLPVRRDRPRAPPPRRAWMAQNMPGLNSNGWDCTPAGKLPERRSIFLPHVLGSLLMLLAFAIFPLGVADCQPCGSAQLAGDCHRVAELGFKDNLFGVSCPRPESQNVFAVIPPVANTDATCCWWPLDTQRTPIFFTLAALVKATTTSPPSFLSPISYKVLLYTLAIFVPLGWIWYATIPSAICA